jgi:hypothetical protein
MHNPTTRRPQRQPARTIQTVLFTLAMLLCLGLVPGTALGGNISIAWDPVTDPDVAGYRVYVGSAPGSGDQGILDVGPATSATLTGLPDCASLYVGVKAIDFGGNESPGFSGYISGLAQPYLSSSSPSDLEQGQEAVVVRVSGANFTSGMQRTDLEFDDPDVRVVSLQYLSCSELELEVSVGPYFSNPGDPDYNGAGGVVEEVPPAQIGGRAVTLGAPDGSGYRVRGATLDAVNIDFVPVRTDIDGSGRVDGFDLARLSRAFGSSYGGGVGYDGDVDLDGDKTVDGIDLSLLADYFSEIF